MDFWCNLVIFCVALMGLYDLQIVTEETQSFVIGGAAFTKQANGDLFATGPLIEDIVVMVRV